MAEESVLRDRQPFGSTSRVPAAPTGEEPVRDKVDVYLCSTLAVDNLVTEVYKERPTARGSKVDQWQIAPGLDQKDVEEDDGLCKDYLCLYAADSCDELIRINYR